MENSSKQSRTLDEMLSILEEKLVEQQETGKVVLDDSKLYTCVEPPAVPATQSEAELKFKDRLLPLANVSKIMKSSVPEVAKISKDAKAIVQQSASEFIAIVTCKAKEIAAMESRKAVTGDDLIQAMDALDLSCFSDITAKYFEQYKKTTNTYASLYFDQKRNGY